MKQFDNCILKYQKTHQSRAKIVSIWQASIAQPLRLGWLRSNKPEVCLVNPRFVFVFQCAFDADLKLESRRTRHHPISHSSAYRCADLWPLTPFRSVQVPAHPTSVISIKLNYENFRNRFQGPSLKNNEAAVENHWELYPESLLSQWLETGRQRQYFASLVSIFQLRINVALVF